VDIVRALVEAGADVNAVEPCFGAVPLHKATYNGHVKITRVLAHARGGARLSGPSNGYTPLHDALWHGFKECARVLVDAGARLDLEGHDGLRPIQLAANVLGEDDDLVALIRQSGRPRQG
jgi:ankyrin repeat protein